MEKNGEDERRVMSRQSDPNKKKPHHLPVVSGNVEKEKLRREKVKRLSAVDREMGFDGGDEQFLHSTTVSSVKFRLPRKIFNDSNTSVPRKLRSAIRKRSCESASMAMPNANRQSNSLKKSKLSMNGRSDHSSREAVSVEISKDEEEVAETLFALAGLIPHDGVRANDKDEKSLEEKMTDLSKIQNNDAMPSYEDPMILTEEPKTANLAPTTDGPPRDSLKMRTMNDSTPLAWSKLSERQQMNPNFKVSVSPAHFQIPPLLRACDDRRVTHSTSFYGSTEQNLERGLNETNQEKFQFPKRESHINLGAVDLAASQDTENAISSEHRANALTLRPSHGPGTDGFPSQSAATIFPSWSGNASSSKLVSCKDTPSAGKIPYSINGGRKSWRRCVTHVYISRLIQVLQSSERRDTHPLDTSLLRPLQCQSAGDVAGNPNGLNTTATAGHMFGSASDKNIGQPANDVPVLPKNCQVEEKGRSLSGYCDSKVESYNFLSLSTGAGTELNNVVSANRLNVTMDATDHVFQLHSLAQHNTYVPCSMPQNSFPSIHYGDHVGAVSAAQPSMQPQVHIQVPSFYSNHCGPVPLGTARSTQLSHPKQQQIWTTQLAAQFRSSPLLSTHIANWQNITQDPHSMIPMQAHLPASRSTLETIGSKYLHIPQPPQQQLLGLNSSLPISNVKIQNSQLPSIREEKGGRFHPDGVLPLQLLCNERLLS